MSQPAKTSAGRYTALSNSRSAVLRRARACSALTIPALLPPEGHNETSSLPEPFQSLGARGVNNLASKLLLSLLPPNSTFFRLAIDDFTLERLTQQKGMRGEIEKGLAKMERAVMTEIEGSTIRVSSFEAFKLLLVTGNALIYLPPEGGMRVFRLDRYVVKRDPMGNVTEIIVKETISPDAVPMSIQLLAGQSETPEKSVDLYTHIRRHKANWSVKQEIKGYEVPGSQGTYPLDKCPWLPLRFTKIDGENYGRGHVEEYFGDLSSLEALTMAIVQGSIASARTLILVNPNGTTRMSDVAKAPNGAVRAGNRDDVTTLQMDKSADLRVALDTVDKLESRLSFAFLINSAIQRPGDRVTAEEIRYMANELETSLGGVYSVQSQEYQLPLVSILMNRMERQKRIPMLPKGIVRPTITTGIEALGRGNDMNKLSQFGQLAVQAAGLPPEINKAEFLKRAGTSLGIDMDGLVKTPEQMAAEQQQAQMQAMIDKLGPNAMNILRDQMNPANQQVQNGQEAPAPVQAGG